MDVKINKMLLSFAILAGIALMLSGCPKKAEIVSSQEAQTQSATEAETVKQAEERKAAEASARKKGEEENAARENAVKEKEGLKPIHFDFDKADIRADARTVLTANAEWLRSHGTAKVRIEGNCDEQGTAEYNQALGQRRAQSAKKYLTGLGISASRMTLLSYGKEKPVCTESAEECWWKNRRDDFIVSE
jgi:peptidoglycan-associated lipoprotein